MIKILRVVIWVNGLMSVLLALSLLVAWITIFNPPPNSYLFFTVASIFSAICATVIPILGIFMVVMEILSRKGRNRDSAGDDAQVESS